MSPITSVSPSSRAAPHQVTLISSPGATTAEAWLLFPRPPGRILSCPRQANEGGLMVLSPFSLGRRLRSKEMETKKKKKIQLLIEIADSEKIHK